MERDEKAEMALEQGGKKKIERLDFMVKADNVGTSIVLLRAKLNELIDRVNELTEESCARVKSLSVKKNSFETAGGDKVEFAGFDHLNRSSNASGRIWAISNEVSDYLIVN